MANWSPLKIVDCIEKIEKEELVLPVVQRDFVWTPEKIELLFDTLLKGDSFGGIMTIKDIKGKKPIFSYREFIKNYHAGVSVFSKNIEKLKQNISYIVDGQQRLSAFYIGMQGKYENKQLYLDLLSEIEHKNFNFKFSLNEKNLNTLIDNYDGSKKIKTFWYSITNIYRKIEESGGDYHTTFDEIIHENNEIEFSNEEEEKIKRNIENFTNQVFNFQNIGICEVRIDTKYDEIENRIRVVELFRRLNQGGTKLDGLELMASKLKGFDAENEKFLHDIKEFEDIGFGKDEVIKLVFILQDDHKKTLVNITKNDSDFIKNNIDRIKSSIKGVKSFLQQSNLYTFFKAERPSIIPLYFIAYHLFHTNIGDNQKIEEYFDNSEIRNNNYNLIYRWMFLSMLNRVFRRRGTGWTAYSTGIRKILEIIKQHKNQSFPTNELFEMYLNHQLDFSPEIKKKWLDDYDFNFLFFSIYEKPKNFRKNDIDHIHPKSILDNKYEWNQINSASNYQLLDYSSNRSKNANEFYDWIYTLKNMDSFLEMHLIPNDENLWKSDNFEAFLSARGEIIRDKLRSHIE